MLTELEFELLAFLLNRKEEKIEKITKILFASAFDIENASRKINELFEGTIVVSPENELIYIEKNNFQIYTIMDSQFYLIQKYLSIESRRAIITLILLLKNEYLSLIHFSDSLNISKNTALNDIKSIKEEILQKELYLVYSRKDGYKIQGNEFIVRKLINEKINEIIKLPIGKYLLGKMKFISLNEANFLSKRLEKVESRLEITFSDENLDTLPYTCLAIIERIKQFLIPCEFSQEISKLSETKEYITVSSIFWNHTYLEESDLLYLVLMVLSSNVVKSELMIEPSIKNFDQLSTVIESFIGGIESRLAIKFFNRSKLLEALYRHLNPAIYRNLLGLKVINPLTKQFEMEHEDIFKVVGTEMHKFEEFTDKPFSNDEVAFIAMIVLSNIFVDQEWLTPKTFSAVVVCKSGTSVSQLLTRQLRKLFPMMSFERVLSLREFQMEQVKEDFVFTTIPLNNEKNIFLVSSIMNQSEKDNLKERVENTIQSDNLSKARHLLSYLDEVLDRDKEKQALSLIENYFSRKPIQKEQKTLHLLLNEENQISIFEGEVSWDDVIGLSFNDMKSRNTITQNYIQRCEELFVEDYDSLLIGPEVLMPHATPEEGVILPDVQINVFKKALLAPNGKSYYLTVALAPGKNQEHLEWLIALNKLLLKDGIKQRFLDANSSLEVLEIINSQMKYRRV